MFPKNSIFLWLAALLFSGCATASFDTLMTAPDTAMISARGSYRSDDYMVTSALFKQCAHVTLQHGYRYFILARPWTTSLSESRSVVPGSSFTTGNAWGHAAGGFAWDNANSNTVYIPPAVMVRDRRSISVVIKMSNDPRSLLPFSVPLPHGNYSKPKDAAFIVAGNR